MKLHEYRVAVPAHIYISVLSKEDLKLPEIRKLAFERVAAMNHGDGFEELKPTFTTYEHAMVYVADLHDEPAAIRACSIEDTTEHDQFPDDTQTTAELIQENAQT